MDALKDAKSDAHIRKALDTMIVNLEDKKNLNSGTEEFLKIRDGRVGLFNVSYKQGFVVVNALGLRLLSPLFTPLYPSFPKAPSSVRSWLKWQNFID